MKIDFLSDEVWFGFCVKDSQDFPLTASSTYSRSIDPNPTNNQAAPFLVSNKGRYIHSTHGFTLDCRNGVLTVESTKAPVHLKEGFKTLKEAFCAAAKAHFPANGVTPPKEFFTKPQYNTWIELIYDQNQQDILAYAQGILDNGLPPGILMIDDGWSDYYGRWEFRRLTFPQPKEMIKKLHDMGFQVMMWVCPFISADSLEMRTLHKQGLLVKEKDGSPAVRNWWNGYSAVLDFTNPQAQTWFAQQLDYLMQTYQVDGFKFDAGDGTFYRDDDCTFAPTDANGQTALWAEFGARYPYNEYRACFACQGLPLVQRLADKNHSWDDKGLASLIPSQLGQGILGYAFTCPDMVGGGEYENFTQNSKNLDAELFVRYAQCAALMPMLQFSAAPWRVLKKEQAALCVEAAKLHNEHGEYIYQLAEHAAKTGEPIVRYMEYEFAHQGFATVTDQFMLGSDILAAPVLTKGAKTRTVLLPKGTWHYCDGTIYTVTEDSGKKIEVAAELSVLPYFKKKTV